MSRGLGKTQRAILRLIAQAKPEDAWTFAEICERVYGDNIPTRAQLSAVKRALKRMHLPGTWRTGRAWGRDRRWWLYDPRRLAADPWHRCPLAPIELAELELVEISLPAEDA
jgi:hypothetical protein